MTHSMTIRMNAAFSQVQYAQGDQIITADFNPRKGIERGQVCDAMKATLGMKTSTEVREYKNRRRRRGRKQPEQSKAA